MVKTTLTLDSIISRFEVLSHGFNGSQYFQGCGTAFTEFNHVFTGNGDNEREAAEDALDQMAQSLSLSHDSLMAITAALKLDDLSTETDDEDTDEDEGNEPRDWYYYFSIRLNTLADEIVNEHGMEDHQNKLAFDDCGTLYLKL